MEQAHQECTIDHELTDVKARLRGLESLDFGGDIAALLDSGAFNQEQINEIFHHLKKLHKYRDKIQEIVKEVK